MLPPHPAPSRGINSEVKLSCTLRLIVELKGVALHFEIRELYGEKVYKEPIDGYVGYYPSMSGGLEKNYRNRTHHDKRPLTGIEASNVINTTIGKLERKLSADVRNEM
jgi:hypothetical protein